MLGNAESYLKLALNAKHQLDKQKLQDSKSQTSSKPNEAEKIAQDRALEIELQGLTQGQLHDLLFRQQPVQRASVSQRQRQPLDIITGNDDILQHILRDQNFFNLVNKRAVSPIDKQKMLSTATALALIGDLKLERDWQYTVAFYNAQSRASVPERRMGYPMSWQGQVRSENRGNELS